MIKGELTRPLHSVCDHVAKFQSSCPDLRCLSPTRYKGIQRSTALNFQHHEKCLTYFKNTLHKSLIPKLRRTTRKIKGKKEYIRGEPPPPRDTHTSSLNRLRTGRGVLEANIAPNIDFIGKVLLGPLPASYETAILLPPGLGEVFHFVRSPAFGLLWLLLCVRVLNASNDGRVKDLFEVLLSQGRALDVGGGFDLLGTQLRRLLGHRFLFALVQLNEDFDIFSEIRLSSNEDDGGFGAVAPDLGHPLLRDVLEGGGADHTEAQQEDVRIRVAERPESVELILQPKHPKGF